MTLTSELQGHTLRRPAGQRQSFGTNCPLCLEPLHRDWRDSFLSWRLWCREAQPGTQAAMTPGSRVLMDAHNCYPYRGNGQTA